jgi:S-adenosylmethionine-diacylgycerolhomoserine-N-methlytransferase
MSSAQNAAHLMDRIYRPQRHIYDATRKYYLLGRDRLIRDLQPAPSNRVMEIGCGTGRNLIVAARLYPQAEFFGIDVSREMLVTAHRALRRCGLDQQVHIAHADATNFAPHVLFARTSQRCKHVKSRNHVDKGR